MKKHKTTLDEFLAQNSDENSETLYVALVFDTKKFSNSYNKAYREELANNAYEAVLDQLDQRWPLMTPELAKAFKDVKLHD